MGLRKEPVVILETGTRFDSVKEAAEYFNVLPGTVCNHLRGRARSLRGLHLQYERLIKKDPE